MHIKCEVCKGHKTIKGLGSLERKCPRCKGVGYTNQSSQPEVLQVKEPKRRGRKPTNFKVE